MKILLISNMYPSTIDPTYGTFVKNFNTQLTQEGFEVEKAVITGRGKTKLEKIKKYFNLFKDIIKAIKKNDYDLIYVHYVTHSLLPLLLIQKHINKPLVVNAHGSDVFTVSKTASLIQKLVTPIIKKASLVVVPSDYFKEVVQNKFTLAKNKIFVSPSGGIDTNLFRLMDKKESDIFTIGFVSRIDNGKGWDVLLDAASLLQNKNYNFKVLMLGGGSQENLLLKKIDDLNLHDIVEYIGAKPHEELVDYFNQMNIFAFTTRLAESLGLVGLEAMACGIPVVGSNIGGLPSYISDGINGKLFEPKNSSKLSERIEFFMDMDSSKINYYKEQALITAKKYDSKNVAKILSDKLRSLVDADKTINNYKKCLQKQRIFFK